MVVDRDGWVVIKSILQYILTSMLFKNFLYPHVWLRFRLRLRVRLRYKHVKWCGCARTKKQRCGVGSKIKKGAVADAVADAVHNILKVRVRV